MVCDDIKNTQCLGLPNEYFLGFINGQDKNWEDFKSRLNQSCTDNDYCAIKVMASQYQLVEHQYNQLVGKRYSFNQIIHELGQPVYIRIIRKDKVYQAISRLMAERTGVYHHVAYTKKGYGLTVSEFDLDDGYNNQIAIENEDIYKAIMLINKEEKLWDDFFIGNRLSPQLIYYEEAIDDLSYINTILHSQGVPQVACLADIAKARNVRCLANDYSQALYANYKMSQYI
jgi:LPS sulfotransferase NodH